ncbi:MAG: dTMP kinase [Acidimicrobiia bacterium]|nr:dTMP kinase [Acidimicrobiia bacterium]
MRYIAFEGVDGAGKTTVAGRVADALRHDGFDVVMVREPGGTPIGEAVRQILLEAGESMVPRTEALLFAAARTQLAAEVIEPALAHGSFVLSDRTVYSSLAYQGGGRNLGVESVREPNVWGLGKVWPDLVIWLDVDPETGLFREDGADRISNEGPALMQAVAGAYRALSESEPERIHRIDAGQDLDRVVADCLAVIEAAS